MQGLKDCTRTRAAVHERRLSCTDVKAFSSGLGSTIHFSSRRKRASTVHCKAEQGEARRNPAFQVSTEEDRVRLRSEAEAPFRSLRLTFYGFSVVSAGVGLLVSIPQLISSLGGAPNAMATQEVLTNLGINGGAAGLFAVLFSQDWKARQKQMARLTREEKLSACGVQLANGKQLLLAQLRGSARIVVCAGTHAQVREALAAAEPHKEELKRRGVLVVPLPIYEDGSCPSGEPLEAPGQEDLRWRATPVRLDAWREWFSQQLSLSSKATPDRGLYVSLRKDGRVRGSGMGTPPWAQLAVQLPPEEGIWTGLLDGMDGRV